MSNALLTVGVLVGSFMIVVCFSFIISRIARAKQRQRMIEGVAFAVIKKEQTRFQGEIKRVVITPKRPNVNQMFEL